MKKFRPRFRRRKTRKLNQLNPGDVASSSGDEDDRSCDSVQPNRCPTQRISQVRREALNLIAIHKATAVAADSTSNILNRLRPCETVIDFVELSRQQKELQLATIRAEHSLLDKISMEMNYDDKVHTIFDIIDEDCSGFLNAHELSVAFNKVDYLDAGHSMMQAAQKLIPEYTKDDSEICVVEFQEFLLKLSNSMDAPINDIAKFVVSKINFGATGRQILETAVALFSTDNNNNNAREQCPCDSNEDHVFHQAIIQARLILLFDMMDFQTVDRVDPRLLARYLSPFCEESGYLMEKMRDLASSMDENTISFCEFSDIIMQVAEELRMTERHFHHLFNSITLQTCRQNINEMHIQRALSSSDDDHTVDVKTMDDEVHDLLNYGKLCRLFDLFDVDHDGTISRAELVQGLKHFHKQSNTGNILANRMIASIIDAKVMDKVLSMQDFANLMAKLACASGSEVHRFIDFLLVQGVLGDEEESRRSRRSSLEHVSSLAAEEDDSKRTTNDDHSKKDSSGNNNKASHRRERHKQVFRKLSRQVSTRLAPLAKFKHLHHHRHDKDHEGPTKQHHGPFGLHRASNTGSSSHGDHSKEHNNKNKGQERLKHLFRGPSQRNIISHHHHDESGGDNNHERKDKHHFGLRFHKREGGGGSFHANDNRHLKEHHKGGLKHIFGGHSLRIGSGVPRDHDDNDDSQDNHGECGKEDHDKDKKRHRFLQRESRRSTGGGLRSSSRQSGDDQGKRYRSGRRHTRRSTSGGSGSSYEDHSASEDDQEEARHNHHPGSRRSSSGVSLHEDDCGSGDDHGKEKERHRSGRRHTRRSTSGGSSSSYEDHYTSGDDQKETRHRHHSGRRQTRRSTSGGSGSSHKDHYASGDDQEQARNHHHSGRRHARRSTNGGSSHEESGDDPGKDKEKHHFGRRSRRSTGGGSSNGSSHCHETGDATHEEAKHHRHPGRRNQKSSRASRRD